MTGDQPASGHGGPGAGRTGGLLDHLRELLASSLDYLQARLALAGIEAKEALLHFAIIVALLAAAAAVCIFGYLFLCIAATVLIARWVGISQGWVILALAALHFVVGAGCALVAVLRLKTSVFTETLAELKKDRQWLNRPTN